MSPQCPHYVRTTSLEGYMSHKGDVVRTLCSHCADIYLQGYMFAQWPHYILRFSALEVVFVSGGQEPSLWSIKQDRLDIWIEDFIKVLSLSCCVRQTLQMFPLRYWFSLSRCLQCLLPGSTTLPWYVNLSTSSMSSWLTVIGCVALVSVFICLVIYHIWRYLDWDQRLLSFPPLWWVSFAFGHVSGTGGQYQHIEQSNLWSYKRQGHTHKDKRNVTKRIRRMG